MFVYEKEIHAWEAGFNGQDVGCSAGEAVGCSPLGLVREGRELTRHVDGRFEGISAIAEDGEEEWGGQTMAHERREAHPWAGEPFDSHEGSLGLGHSFG